MTDNRYKCRDCGETFLQPLGVRNVGERVPEALDGDVVGAALGHQATRRHAVRSVGQQYIQRLHEGYRLPAVQFLGIDEVHIGGEAR